MADQIQIVNPPTAKEIEQNNEYLFRCTSLFPFQLFPDEVILDKLKISIIKRDFFFTKRIITLPLTGTVNVKVYKGPITSMLEMMDMSTLNQQAIRVRHVLNDDAVTFHRLVEGIVIGMRQGVNFMDMERNEMMDSAMKWGAVDVEGV